jgi:hypothetical protein
MKAKVLMCIVSLGIFCSCDFSANEKANQEYHNRMNQKCIAVIIRTQLPSAGWNEIKAATYVKKIPENTFVKLDGLWGNEGDTIIQTNRWFNDNKSWSK